MASLPPGYAPLRAGPDDGAARQAEKVLEAAFATAPAAAWTARLRALGLLAELIEPLDRDGFRRAVLDAPSTVSSAASSPTRPPAGAGSSRSARSCAAVPRTWAARA